MRLLEVYGWIARPKSGVDRGAFLVLVAFAASFAFGVAEDWSGFADWAATVRVGLAIALLGYASRLLRLGPDAALVLGATLVTGTLGLNAGYIAFFGRPLDTHELQNAVDALRSGAVPVRLDTAILGAGLLAVAWSVLTILLRLIALIPRPKSWRADPAVWHPIGLLLAGGAGLSTTAPEAAPSERDLFATKLQFERLPVERETLRREPVKAAHRYDVIVLVLDSLRYDMLRPEVMPNLSQLSTRCLTPSRHYTTGGNTGTGLFGLLTGLAAPYYPLAARARLRPLPLEILGRLGYRRSVYFVNNIRTYERLYDLFFEGQVDYVYTGTEPEIHVADRNLANDLLRQLRERDPATPEFAFALFDSTHYDYSYPPEYEKFVPQGTLELGFRDGIVVSEGINERLRSRAPMVRNRYQNAAHWLDSVIGEVVQSLGPMGLDHTLLVVTSDHGEEFWEKGTFGHGFTLTEEATRVPLVLCAPGGMTTRYSVSTHADVVPTLFDVLGVDAGSAAVVSGKSWLRYDPTLDVALVGAGTTRQRTTTRFSAVARGAKVIWRNRPPYELEEIWDTQDRRSSVLTPAAADELIARAIISQRLRPLPQP